MKRSTCLFTAVLIALSLSYAAGYAGAMEHATAVPASQIPPYIAAAVNSSERPAADRKLDAGRSYDQLMTFYGVKPGMKVADVIAGSGVTTEVLSLIVGPNGTVYSLNPMGQSLRGRAWRSRIKELKNVVGLGAPMAPETKAAIKPNSLDFVIINLNYHDLVGHKIDTLKLNRWVMGVLKPGGVYGVVDSAAAAGSGARDTTTLHRIDPQYVINDVEKAGFTLQADSNILAHPEDNHTQLQFKMPGHVDRFVLKFVKPA